LFGSGMVPTVLALAVALCYRDCVLPAVGRRERWGGPRFFLMLTADLVHRQRRCSIARQIADHSRGLTQSMHRI